MLTYGGMQFRTLSKNILGKFAKSMRAMEGCIDMGFFRRKKLCHHLNMNL
jgi:hypothetical protein